EHRRARDELADLVLALAAERAVKELFPGGGFFRHQPGSLAVRTLSTMPYFTASSADRKLSRSVSLAMVSTDWPVCLARISFSRWRRNRISRAWISTSEAWPEKPPIGWWIITREFGSTKRLVLSPA